MDAAFVSDGCTAALATAIDLYRAMDMTFYLTWAAALTQMEEQ